MNPKLKLIIGTVTVLAALLLLGRYVQTADIALLDPKGFIALRERNLMYLALGLMMIVVVPVFLLTFFISWHFREGNTKAKYRPDWHGSIALEAIWWLIPLAIITVLALVTWRSSHELDPFKPLTSTTKPLRVQVVALEWKWLFIYPEQGIATVNMLQIPKDVPVNLEITSDAPMNSFWIPRLSGQIYAMSGMTTKLHIIANDLGSYPGVSANLSGEGFADMQFMTAAVPADAFESWVHSVQQSSQTLDYPAYLSLAERSVQEVPLYYTASAGLYDDVMMQFMPHAHSSKTKHVQRP